MPSILVWNDDFQLLPATVDDCDVECRLITDPVRIAEAQAVVFHVPSLRTPLDGLWKRPGQQWVAWSLESEAYYPRLADPAFMAAFDLTMTYRRDADVWWPYLEQPEAMLRAPEPKTEVAPAVYVASNPRPLSRRDHYVAALMRHLDVDSYGRSLHTRDWPAGRWRGRRSTKLETIARYRFTLAFENSICEDYVTEKFFDPLVAGSVPVYLGAPNVADFAPAEHCYIDVRDFNGPEDLAVHLRALAADDAAYGEHLAWKADGVRPEYRGLTQVLGSHPLCRLARLLAGY